MAIIRILQDTAGVVRQVEIAGIEGEASCLEFRGSRRAGHALEAGDPVAGDGCDCPRCVDAPNAVVVNDVEVAGRVDDGRTGPNRRADSAGPPSPPNVTVPGGPATVAMFPAATVWPKIVAGADALAANRIRVLLASAMNTSLAPSRTAS